MVSRRRSMLATSRSPSAAGPDPYLRGFGCNPRKQDPGTGVGKRGDRVVLRLPVSVEAQLLRCPCQANGRVHRLRGAVAADDGRLIQNAQAHRLSNLLIYRKACSNFFDNASA